MQHLSLAGVLIGICLKYLCILKKKELYRVFSILSLALYGLSIADGTGFEPFKITSIKHGPFYHATSGMAVRHQLLLFEEGERRLLLIMILLIKMSQCTISKIYSRRANNVLVGTQQ